MICRFCNQIIAGNSLQRAISVGTDMGTESSSKGAFPGSYPNLHDMKPKKVIVNINLILVTYDYYNVGFEKICWTLPLSLLKAGQIFTDSKKKKKNQPLVPTP